MKKSFIFGAALMLAGAFGLQSCSQEDNGGKPLEPTVAVIDNGMDLKDVIEQFAVDNKVTLPAGVELTMKEAIELTEPLTITTDAEKPATIIANAGFVISDAFTLENVKIDATNLTSELITLSEEGNAIKNETLWPEAVNKGASVINDIAVKNTWIKNLQKSLITVKSSWVVTNLTIQNNIIQLANSESYFVDFYSAGNSAFKNLYMDGNTIYNTEVNKSQFVFRFNNASNAIKLFGTNSNPEADRFHWEITNNTLIGLFAKKDFGNNIPNNKCVTNIIKNNILFNVFRLQKFIQSNQERTYSDNFIWSDGTTTIDSTDKTTYCKEVNPGFAAPTEALDFTKEKGGLNLTPSGEAAAAGDPRWFAIQ